MAIFLKTSQKSGSQARVLHQPLAAGPRGTRRGTPGKSRDGTERQSLQAAAGLEREVDGSRSMVWEF